MDAFEVECLGFPLSTPVLLPSAGSVAVSAEETSADAPMHVIGDEVALLPAAATVVSVELAAHVEGKVVLIVVVTVVVVQTMEVEVSVGSGIIPLPAVIVAVTIGEDEDDADGGVSGRDDTASPFTVLLAAGEAESFGAVVFCGLAAAGQGE